MWFKSALIRQHVWS